MNHVKTELMPEIDFDEFDREREISKEEASVETTSEDTELKWD